MSTDAITDKYAPALMGTGLIILACTLSSSMSPSVQVGISIGFAMTALALIALIMEMSASVPRSETTPYMSTVLAIIARSFPVVSLLCLVAYLMYIMSYFFAKIIRNLVSPDYFTCLSWFVGIYVIDLFMLYSAVRSQEYTVRHIIRPVYLWGMNFLNIIIVIILITMRNSLLYYTTDG